jgi:thiosulfate/3-mercaptopyruvate sulfurtransferase
MAAEPMEDAIVSTEWLEEHRNDPDVRIVDMRGYVVTRQVEPGVEVAEYRGARDEYLAEHIPGSVYVDWTADIIDPNDPVPVQIAPPERFAEAMATLGIGDETHVIAVDHTGGQFATRLWWALAYYGHERVSILDGGWNRWVEEDREIESGPVSHARATFTPRVRPDLRINAEDLAIRLDHPGFALIDARDEAQYRGTKRRAQQGGRIPGARHLPRELFFARGGGFLPADEVRRRVEESTPELVTDPEMPVIAYCNGGVAATFVLFNLHRIGLTNLTNYDGSWNEWGNRPDLPRET